MIRNILVLVRGDDKGDNVLAHAAALARCFKAHIEVTAVPGQRTCCPDYEKEVMFGGNTQSIIEKADMSVVMVH